MVIPLVPRCINLLINFNLNQTTTHFHLHARLKNRFSRTILRSFLFVSVHDPFPPTYVSRFSLSLFLFICLLSSSFFYFFCLPLCIIHHRQFSPLLLSCPFRLWHKPTSTERHSCRGLSPEESGNDVTLLERNRENQGNLEHRDHPVPRDPKVFLDTKADKERRVTLDKQVKREHQDQLDRLVRLVHQGFRVPR